MAKNTVFRVNSPEIVSETIDGEVVIINLDKGYYYSLLKTGADVWSRIERHLDRDRIIQELTEAYDGIAEEIAIAIDEFIANLQHEQLIVADSSLEFLPSEPIAEIANQSSKPRFQKPMLEKFTDMEDLLLLDPIHEVDVEAGWPNAKTT